ncbi:uncharacterized protein LOC133317521 [Gastrolobium bilobum]|uniref:uncharacterized protein LOC133317521 n=1 Tax=Gastrolobium bilobum TaxID=150636 RepID=UPI002AB2D066|nr:uncharacterized protein LOC133317521 [Gastrolobium bilobum]
MAIKRNLMKEHQETIVLEGTPTKLSMKCCKYEQGCPWRVRVIKPTYGEKWKVTKWGGDHDCLNDHISQGHRQLDAHVIALLVLGMIREEPSVSISLVQVRITHAIVSKFLIERHVIQVNGTHLYGNYKGKLLIATAQDGNAECLPLSFAIVEGETLEAWQYFLDNILHHVTQKQNICLISDRHRSILSAVESHRGWQPPHAQHMFCLRHIASYTPSKVDFDIAFAKFRDISPEIADWIDQIPKEKWMRAYDVDGLRYGHMTTNLFESVNRVLKGARNMPITGLVKYTYSKLVHYFVERGQAAAAQLHASHRHCKNIVEAMKFNESLATGHNVRTYNVDETVFEVDEGYERLYSVNLPQKYCQCGKFKAFKYPCSHPYAAALSVRRNTFGYVDDVFLTENLVHAYSFLWQPIGNEVVIPPSVGAVIIPDRSMLRAKGRPKSTRIYNEMDEVEASQSRIKCGLCKLPGHNRRSCPNHLPNQ